jgi:solute carrier family 12 (potassium/chloride transporter), member 4/6
LNLREKHAQIDKMMEDNDLVGFSEVVSAPSWAEGAKYVIQLSGLGGLRPNTLVISWPMDWRQAPQRAVDFLKIVSLALMEDKAVVCPKDLDKMPLGDHAIEQTGFIDLWWFITDGGLLVLLTWLLAQHKIWRGCSVRVFVVVENVSPEMAEAAAETVRGLFREKRILADVVVEAVILSNDMIQAYTYDYTLKVGERKKMGATTNTILPHTLDDLFSEHSTSEDIKTPADDSVESASAAPKRRSRFRKIISKALRRGETPEDSQPESIADAFSRQGTFTEDNEKELLDTLNARCQQRRRTLEEEAGKIEEVDEEEEDDVSVIGDLPIPTLRPATPVQQKPSATFERLNQMILTKSKESSLVLLNLPDVWGTSMDDCIAYMAFCDCLVKGIDRVIFVHSAGTEVVRIF